MISYQAVRIVRRLTLSLDGDWDHPLIDGQPVIGGTSDADAFVQSGPSRRVIFGGKGVKCGPVTQHTPLRVTASVVPLREPTWTCVHGR